MKRLHFSLLLVLFATLSSIHCLENPITPLLRTLKNGSQVTLREIQYHEFKIVEDLAIKVAQRVYNLTEKAEIEALIEANKDLIQEELYQFSHNYFETCSLVALEGETIVGFFSAQKTSAPGQLYIRVALVDTPFQNQGLLKIFLQRTLTLIPEIQTMILLTNKKNQRAQMVYEHMQGEKVENPSWATHLPPGFQAANYFGYSFDQASTEKIRASYKIS